MAKVKAAEAEVVAKAKAAEAEVTAKAKAAAAQAAVSRAKAKAKAEVAKAIAKAKAKAAKAESKAKAKAAKAEAVAKTKTAKANAAVQTKAKETFDVSKTYKSGVWCGASDGILTTLKDCKAAAAKAGITFASKAGTEWHAGCIINGGKAYFVPLTMGEHMLDTCMDMCIDMPWACARALLTRSC